MKALFSSILSFFFILGLSAQAPLVLNPNPVLIEAAETEDRILPIAYLKNVTENDTITFLWRRIIDEIPESWEPAVCDQTSCYPPNTTVCPDDSPNILYPGDSTAFYVQLKPNEEAGTATIKLEAYPVGFPDSILVTGVYEYNVLMTSTLEVITLNSRLIPNPAQDYFQLELPETDGELQIISSNGLIVKRFSSLSANGTYDIQNLPKGQYWVHWVREDNSLVKAMGLVKQ